MEEWDRIIKVVSRLVNNGYFLGFHATKWNPKSGFTFKPSKIRKWFQVFLTVLRNVYLLFLAVRHFQLSQYTELPFHKRGQIMYFFFVYVADNVIAIYGTIFNYESLHNIIQSNLDMAINFEREHGIPTRIQTGKSIRVMAACGLLVTYPGSLLLGIANLRSPHLPIFLSSITENPKRLHWRIGSAFIQTFVVSNFSYGLMCFSTIVLVWVFCLIRLILGLRDLCAQKFSEEQQRRYYRILGVSQTKLVSDLGTVIFAAHSAAVIVMIWNLSEAVILHTPRSIIFAFVAIKVNSSYQATCSAVIEESEKLLEQWKTVRGSRGFRKFTKACKRIHVPLGRYFFHDRSLMLTTAALVLDNFVNMVMMINS